MNLVNYIYKFTIKTIEIYTSVLLYSSFKINDSAPLSHTENYESTIHTF